LSAPIKLYEFVFPATLTPAYDDTISQDTLILI